VSKGRLVALLVVAVVVSSAVGYGVTRLVEPSPTRDLSHPAVAVTERGPIDLLGNGIGSVLFGTRQSQAIARLETSLGRLQTIGMISTHNCELTAMANGSNVQIAFAGGKFVGYEIGSADGRIVFEPDVATSKGLRLGDSASEGEQIYGSAFSTSAAQGGSWKAQTSAGQLFGLLVGPPGPVGNSDQVQMIAAGDLGCPGMTP
jgi:hypothetical protein